MPELNHSALLSDLLLALVVSAIWLGVLLAARLTTVARFRKQEAILDRELKTLQRKLAQVEKDQGFQTDFLRQFPYLCEQLTSRLTMRELPRVLVEIVERIFDPALSVLVLRRRHIDAEGQPQTSFHVVSAAPSSGPVKLGTMIPVGQGELGFVIENQRAMNHDDLARESSSASWKTRERNNPLSGISFDLAAPMIFAGETVGVLGASGSRSRTATSREVLRLIAQIGALTYYNVAAFRQMKRSAELDRLTGALNKTSITKLLSEEIVEAEKRTTKLSVFLFDIDNFKNYNDVNGHLHGDQLLSNLSLQVREITRGEDTFGRFGGEEFLLVLPETDRTGAMMVAEKVRRHIASQPFPFAENQPLGCVSVSGGVATFPDDARDSTRLLRLADEALYSAKKGGRNRVHGATTTA